MTRTPKTSDLEVLDACCGSRMFHYDRDDPRILFMDNRIERHKLKDRNVKGGYRSLVIEPDTIADFTDMPFADAQFSLVVFDPPHLVRAGATGWLAKKYGVLGADWREEIRKGFSECFRVLKPNGTLIFKWNEYQVPVGELLDLAEVAPLFGNRSGKRSKSHWIVFTKSAPRKATVPKLTLEWSEPAKANSEIRYNHTIALTPFGRFVLTWKGWKEDITGSLGFDETPWSDHEYAGWGTVEEAQQWAEAEFNRRLESSITFKYPRSTNNASI